MAAPTPTARGTPAGIALKNGHPTKVTFATDPDVELWEKTVTPPGVEGGDAIDVTTMHNVLYRTMAPRTLKTLTEASFTAAYDPAVLTALNALINVETTVTITFPDGSTWAFFGFLQNFTPQEVQEGEQPEAECTFVGTNWDHVNDVEAGPAVASVAGT